MESAASARLFRNAAPATGAIGRSMTSDFPQIPCTKRFTHRQYWTGSGSLRPSFFQRLQRLRGAVAPQDHPGDAARQRWVMPKIRTAEHGQMTAR